MMADEAKALAKNIKDKCDLILKQCNDLDKEADLIREKNPYDDIPVAMGKENFMISLLDYELTVRALCNELLALTNDPIVPLMDKETVEEIKEKYDFKKAEIAEVSVYRWTDIVGIKCPMLARRLPDHKGEKDSRSRVNKFPKFYQNEIDSLMQRMEIIPFSDLPNWLNKTLNFVYIYGSKENAIDTDSHEKKAVIDAITKRLPGGDSGLNVCISESTILSDEVPTATYIFMMKGREHYITDEEAIALAKVLIEKTKE